MVLYSVSGLVGVGAAVLWTAQGTFISKNSTNETRKRNNGVFWACFQASLIVGNVYVYFSWKGIDEIESKQRIPLYSVFTGLAGLGCIGFLFLGNGGSQLDSTYAEIDDNDESDIENEENNEIDLNAGIGENFENGEDYENDEDILIAPPTTTEFQKCLTILKQAVSLLTTSSMLLTTITFAYTGFSLSFWSAIYPTCIANTKSFGVDTDSLLGINGIVMGSGQVAGGLLFSILPSFSTPNSILSKLDKRLIICLGFFTQTIGYALFILNFGNDCENGKSIVFEETNYSVSLVIAFLLGFGDCCFNTQIYNHLGDVHTENPAPAFAIFKSVQSVFAAIGFFGTRKIGMIVEGLVLAVFSGVSAISFVVMCHFID